MKPHRFMLPAGVRAATGKFPVLLLLLAACFAFAFKARGADVVVDSSRTFQTIVGWGDGGGFYNGITGGMVDPSVAVQINYQYLDYLADDLGLTGTRVWEVGPRIDGTGMDHGD